MIGFDAVAAQAVGFPEDDAEGTLGGELLALVAVVDLAEVAAQGGEHFLQRPALLGIRGDARFIHEDLIDHQVVMLAVFAGRVDLLRDAAILFIAP